MDVIFFDIAIVIVVSACLAWLTLLTRQPIIIAYIITGVALGPWGLKIVQEIDFIDQVSRLGVTLLLFLVGLVLHPKRILDLFKQTILVTVAACLIFSVLSALFAFIVVGFSTLESIIVGLALMFSSTILVVKLLPTITLHQRHMGFLCIAVLIAQDLIAVGILLFLSGSRPESPLNLFLMPFIGVAFVAIAFLFEQYLLRWVMKQVELYHEVLYLVALGWCFGLALLAKSIGFSYEVGAFIAGLALARSPISLFLSEGLKFFRDFFLVLFFFALGARIDLLVLQSVFFPSLLLTLILLALKPLVYILLFRLTGEKGAFSREIGFRLGQASEFSLIIALFAYSLGTISQRASQLIQTVAIITIVVSSYITVYFFPTPLGIRRKLKQD